MFALLTTSDDFKWTVFQKIEYGIIYWPRKNKLQNLVFVIF
jgi:hypothetical protein